MSRTLAAIALLLLAACDGGGVVDQTIERGVRQSAVQACTTWLPQSEIAQAAGVDPERLCGCAADRILKGKNASNFAGLTPNSSELRDAVAQCVIEVQTAEQGVR